MLTPDGTKLLLLEDFIVDGSLPKYVKQDAEEATRRHHFIQHHRGGGILIEANVMQRGFWARLWFWITSLWTKRESPPTLTVEQFFDNVRNSADELTIVKARAAGYERALKGAKAAGQHALVEQLEQGLVAHAMEAQLLAIGLTKVVTESTVIRFYKQSPKGLRLDWVRNFARPIPEAIVKKKTRADELGCFDNYAVLHFDPQAKSYAETEAEKEAKKPHRDPILFGMMTGRRQLYVIGDWIDELCDLTLDKIVETLGTDAIGQVGSDFSSEMVP